MAFLRYNVWGSRVVSSCGAGPSCTSFLLKRILGYTCFRGFGSGCSYFGVHLWVTGCNLQFLVSFGRTKSSSFLPVHANNVSILLVDLYYSVWEAASGALSSPACSVSGENPCCCSRSFPGNRSPSSRLGLFSGSSKWWQFPFFTVPPRLGCFKISQVPGVVCINPLLQARWLHRLRPHSQQLCSLFIRDGFSSGRP